LESAPTKDALEAWNVHPTAKGSEHDRKDVAGQFIEGQRVGNRSAPLLIFAFTATAKTKI
jgi:hypothetical protein